MAGAFKRYIAQKHYEEMLIPITRWPKPAQPKCLQMSFLGHFRLCRHRGPPDATSFCNFSLQLRFATLFCKAFGNSSLQLISGCCCCCCCRCCCCCCCRCCCCCCCCNVSMRFYFANSCCNSFSGLYLQLFLPTVYSLSWSNSSYRFFLRLLFADPSFLRPAAN